LKQGPCGLWITPVQRYLRQAKLRVRTFSWQADILAQ
jgi:hypothetical protein